MAHVLADAPSELNAAVVAAATGGGSFHGNAKLLAAFRFLRALQLQPASAAAMNGLSKFMYDMGEWDAGTTMMDATAIAARGSAYAKKVQEAAQETSGEGEQGPLPTQRLQASLHLAQHWVAQSEMTKAEVAFADAEDALAEIGGAYDGDREYGDDLGVTDSRLALSPSFHSLRTQVRVKRATALPRMYTSAAHIKHVRASYMEGVASVIAGVRDPQHWLAPLPPGVCTARDGSADGTYGSVQAAATDLGFYLAYQGLDNRRPREKMGEMYKLLCPGLAYVAPHVARADAEETETEKRLLGRESPGHDEGGECGGDHSEDAEVARHQRYRRAAQGLAPPTLRVGFLSSHLCEHSIGKLVLGVIEGLGALEKKRRADPWRRINERGLNVTALLLPLDDCQRDSFTRAIVQAADGHVWLSPDIVDAQAAVGSLELDVLVFCDVGMDYMAYWLAHARMARRQVLFWGHPVTTGLTSVDYFVQAAEFHAHQCDALRLPTARWHLLPKDADAITRTQAAPRAQKPAQPQAPWAPVGLPAGASNCAVHPQELYTERLILLRSLSVAFDQPPEPEAPLTRAPFGLDLCFPQPGLLRPCPSPSPAPGSASGQGILHGNNSPGGQDQGEGAGGGGTDSLKLVGGPPRAHLYLCPQTPFKFHPSMDAALLGILQGDSLAVVVLLQGTARQAAYAAALKRRLASVLGTSLLQRVRFVSNVSRRRFMAMAAVSDVVLEPFPFGGGVTSYEIFSVDAPIVTFASASPYIIQITDAMYRAMAIPATFASASSIPEYARLAVELGTDRARRAELSDLIRTRKHVLYRRRAPAAGQNDAAPGKKGEGAAGESEAAAGGAGGCMERHGDGWSTLAELAVCEWHSLLFYVSDTPRPRNQVLQGNQA
jgi:hypothetical protein